MVSTVTLVDPWWLVLRLLNKKLHELSSVKADPTTIIINYSRHWECEQHKIIYSLV